MVVKEGSYLVILTTLVLPVYFEGWTAVAEAGKCTWHVPKFKLRQLATDMQSAGPANLDSI